ncbi:MAG: chemotaxis protein CheD, partial [Spirochaetota bacterium]
NRMKKHLTPHPFSDIKKHIGSFLSHRPSAGKHIHLLPGDYIVSGDDITVSTVLGSCISVCFYSDSSPFFGMNHFMLPESQYPEKTKKEIMHSDAAFYGINAMEVVINALIHKGVEKSKLKAKVFGGGNVISMRTDGKTVGEQNIEFTMKFLQMEKIPIVACSVGGNYARKIIYFQHSHEVHLRKLSHIADRFIAHEEKALRRPHGKKADIEMFLPKEKKNH